MVIRTVGALGAQIRSARRRQGLTQMQLAERAGVSRSWLIGVERGANPRAEINLVLKVIAVLHLRMIIEERRPPSAGDDVDPSPLNAIINRHRKSTP